MDFAASDADGYNNIKDMLTLINYQGTNSGHYRGYFMWGKYNSDNSYVGYYNNRGLIKNISACAGDGGVAGVYTGGYGPTYVDLTGCYTWHSGNNRYVRYYFHANTNYTTPTTNNDISMYVRDESNVPDSGGWENNDLNFGIAFNRPPNPPVNQSPPNNVWMLGCHGCPQMFRAWVTDPDPSDVAWSMCWDLDIDGDCDLSGWRPLTVGSSQEYWPGVPPTPGRFWRAKARDASGAESAWGETWLVKVYGVPPTSSVTSPAASSWQTGSFSVGFSDADDFDEVDPTVCEYATRYLGDGFPPGWVPNPSQFGPRVCNSSVTVTTGPSAECPTPGTDACRVYSRCYDAAGQLSSVGTRFFSVYWCGDGTCNAAQGETPGNCPADCNSPPTATPASYGVTYETPYTFNLLAGDVDSDPLRFSIVSSPSDGSLSDISSCVNVTSPYTCSITYTPNAGYSGADSFTFKVNDGTVDSNTAMITLDTNLPAWFQAQGGGVYSGCSTGMCAASRSIDVNVPGADYLITGSDGGAAVAVNTINVGSGTVAESDWELESYDEVEWTAPNYERLGDNAVSLPASWWTVLDPNQVYTSGGDLEIDIPGRYNLTARGVTVVYIPAGYDLTFVSDFTTNQTSRGVVFVVADGDVTINTAVTGIDAIIVAGNENNDSSGGNIIISGSGSGDSQLVISGSLLAQEHVNLGPRSLNDNSVPVIQVIYQSFYLDSASFISSSVFSWSEE